MFDAEQASFVCDFIECLQCSNGEPFALINWQRESVEEFYGELIEDEDADTAGSYMRRYQYLYLEIAKKNGKSELAAALAVYHLYADGEINGEVYVVAADRDNAGIVFAAAKHMVETCPTLAKRSRIVDSTKTIYDNVSGSKLKVMSSEAYSKHGYKPSCVIFDELHAQRNRDLWDVMTFGAGDARQQPVWIVLTTAGDDPDRNSIGWEIHCKALAILRYRNGRRTERDYDDPRWLPIMYGLGLIEDEDELAKIDIYDEDLWRRCNPSIGKTIKMRSIRAEAREAKQSEAAERLFRWLRLNQWIATKSVGWIPLTIYDKTQWNPEGCKHWRDAVELLRGKRCFGGVDLSKSTDLTALVLLFPPQDGLEKWVALFQGWVPLDDMEDREKRDHVPFRDWIRAGFLHGCEGDIIDFEDVIGTIVQAAKDYDLRMVGFDPHLGATVMQRVSKEFTDCHCGAQVVEIPQGIQSISPPMKELERLIRSHEMLHIHNTAARWCFGNVRCVTDDLENIRPTKKRSIGRIDITVAWIIAFATSFLEQHPSINEKVQAEEWSLLC
ncbi:terminase TerL endonuclease subunit [Agathobaculum sp. NTUH-O15-33]|uniref:terminase large subunit n=1 Tax=Agathobaculum sp. NTUH-O15-33 TaxID=3079302 RepID=UPI00295831FA|nr:terminase TerL endonuclease subunit [Agathobaculum sp. NTUH-O15-33]WNX85778.1 terminase TerL endonuclease subunit [Agathobaculum sp. NTUH-O15-33]